MASTALAQKYMEALGDHPDETNASKRALIEYAKMEKRSLRDLAKKFKRWKKPPTKHLTTLKTWSRKYDWQRRITEFEKIKYYEQIDEWQRRKSDLREQDWEQGLWLRQDMFKKLRSFARLLRSLDKDQVNALRGVVAIMAQAGDWQRLATDAPTSRIEITGAALDALIAGELARVGHNEQTGVSGLLAANANPNK